MPIYSMLNNLIEFYVNSWLFLKRKKKSKKRLTEALVAGTKKSYCLCGIFYMFF